LTGRISRFDSNISERRTTEERDSKKYTVTWYTRTVNATVTYQIVDAKTAQVISYRTQSLEESSGETEYYRNLEKPFDIVRSSLEELTNRIMRELQPYEVIKRISLLSDKTKDPDMKAADKMVKNGLVAQAETKYLSLYKTGHVFTAGYNAARLMQARGKLQEAEQLMTELVETYSDKRAMSALRDIEYEISQAKKLQRQESARYL
jgi:hypothetical protein